MSFFIKASHLFSFFLQRCSLDSNLIGDDGAAALAAMIRVNRTMRFLLYARSIVPRVILGVLQANALVTGLISHGRLRLTNQ